MAAFSFSLSRQLHLLIAEASEIFKLLNVTGEPLIYLDQ